MVVTLSMLWGEPAAKLRCMVSAPWGSTPYTRQAGCAALIAVATPAHRPPPPMGTITASRLRCLAGQFEAEGCAAEHGGAPFERMDKGAPLIAFDRGNGVESRVHIGRLHQFRPVSAHLGYPERIGAAHHHHLGAGSYALRGEGDRDGVVAGAHRRDAAPERRGIEGERIEQGTPRLEGACALQ